jgi:hypothetical protein
MEMWNEWRKLGYSIGEIRDALNIAKKEGEMGWPTIEDVYNRMNNNHVESVGRFQLSGSELDCIEKALFFIHAEKEYNKIHS